MRLRDNSALPDDVVRELAAIDAVLAGEPVEHELRELAELSMTLRDERPAPSAAFAAELDDRAARGFAGASRDAGIRAREPRSLWGRLVPAPLRGAEPRRFVPAAGVACGLLVALVVSLSVAGRDDGARSGDVASVPPGATTSAPQSKQLGDTAADSAGSGSADSVARAAKPGGAAAVQEAAPVAPTTTTAPVAPLAPNASSPSLPAPSSGALDTARRSVQRGANLTLATSAGRLDDVASGVLSVTDGVGGIVRSSAIDSRPSGGAASFDLEIPTARLQNALARLSQLASVRSRNESSIDVTEQVTYARNRVVALKAERRALLRRLAAGPGFDETTRLRERLRVVDARLREASRQRSGLRRQTRLSSVSVQIVTERRKAAAGKWTPGDAADDALRILQVTLGVALVTLAILAPVAIVGVVAWALLGAGRRRRREQALDASASPAA